MLDLIVRGATVIDGSGAPGVRADIGVRDGRIVEVGTVSDSATRTIDGTDLVACPGFVDPHTHYDAQLFWDQYCSLSGWHGVTSVVIGNCGFGFAPVRPAERERAMLTMTRVEAIPLASMQAGMPWNWVTFPEFLDSVERAPKAVNIVPYMPVSPLLIWVMGFEAAKAGQRPTPEQHAEIRRLLHQAMDAGACGWSMQRTGLRSAHVDVDGTPMATDTMAADDVLALGRVLGRRGEGLIEIFQQSEWKLDDNLAFVERLAESSGRPILYNVVNAVAGRPDYHRRQLAWLAECNRRGLRIYGQGTTVRQPFHVMLADWNLYDMSAAWKQALLGSHEDKKRNLHDAAMRSAMIRDYDEGRIPVGMLGGPIEEWLIEGAMNAPTLDALLGRSVGERRVDVAGVRGRADRIFARLRIRAEWCARAPAFARTRPRPPLRHPQRHRLGGVEPRHRPGPGRPLHGSRCRGGQGAQSHRPARGVRVARRARPFRRPGPIGLTRPPSPRPGAGCRTAWSRTARAVCGSTGSSAPGRRIASSTPAPSRGPSGGNAPRPACRCIPPSSAPAPPPSRRASGPRPGRGCS